MAKQVVIKEQKGTTSQVASRVHVDKPIELKIGYIGGGGRGWSHSLMKDLAKCPWFNGEVRLYDIDYEAAQFNAKFGNWVQTNPKAISKWKYRAVKTMKQALKDVDFVFISIQPGNIELMKHDLEIPMKYGVYQAVGDTTGPGGLMRGLRTTQIYKSFAEAIAQYCPKAWVLNFTNPMSICTRTLHEVFPDIKAFGCCHEVFGAQNLLANLASKKFKVEKPGREEIRVNVLGVNHFTVIDKATWNGVDLLDIMREHIAKPSVMRMYNEKQLLKETTSFFPSKKRVAFEIMKRFDVLGAAGDRHLAEFLPWFLTSEKSCYRWGFRLTPYSYRIKRWKTSPAEFAKQLAGKKPYDINTSGEEFINQMAALLGLTEFRTNVNLPNIGQMGGIKEGAVVETNAHFSKDNVEPIASGRLPNELNSIVAMHAANHEAVVLSALSGDKDMGFRAFINDPLMHRVDLDDAAKMFEKMLKATNFKFLKT
jgi:galacturan 1,4-alpha-galacturonidase